MVEDKKNPPIVIATKEDKDILMSIAIRALYEDRIHLHVIDKHLPKAERLLKILKRFGWIETKRNIVETFNSLCLYNSGGKCTNEGVNFKGSCSEAIRSTCKYYKKRYNFSFRVNQIEIEPIPGIRSL